MLVGKVLADCDSPRPYRVTDVHPWLPGKTHLAVDYEFLDSREEEYNVPLTAILDDKVVERGKKPKK